MSSEGSKVSMIDVVRVLRDEDYGTEKIAKVRNLTTADDNMEIEVEDLNDAFFKLGVNYEVVGELISKITMGDEYKAEDVVYVVHEDQVFKYSRRQWKETVDAIVRKEEEFAPDLWKETLEIPAHMYVSDADGKLYSSLPKVTVHHTNDWTVDDFKIHQANGYE